MKRLFAGPALAAALAAITFSAFAQAPAVGPAAGAGAASWLGRWDGRLEIGEGGMPFSVRIVEAGALLDLPGEELYGYPSASAEASADGLRLAFRFGGGLLTLTGGLEGGSVSGAFSQGAAGGAFSMERSAAPAAPGTARVVRGADGSALYGTLLEPTGTGRPPLVILHAGLGAADRDGNNYASRGRHDALRALGEALAPRGVASYRYDKRGSGESAWLVPSEADQSYEAWIADLAAMVAEFGRSGRYSGVWLLGLNDGAAIAAAAANSLRAAGSPVAGLVVACASADGVRDAYAKAVARAPEGLRAEGEALVASLSAGSIVDSVSSYYAEAFRPSLQPYLIEAFARDLETELAAYAGPCLLVQGNMDLQATLADLLALRATRPDALVAMPLRMNHVLKDVSQDVEDNRAAFADPSYPVSAELVDAITGFIEGTFVGIP